MQVLQSSQTAVRLSQYGIEYKTDGSLIRPKVGKIFVFKNLPDAEYFRNTYGSNSFQQIWKVEAYNCEIAEKRASLSVFNCHSSWRNRLQVFWEILLGKVKEQKGGNPAFNFDNIVVGAMPNGSLFCGSLRMLKRVS